MGVAIDYDNSPEKVQEFFGDKADRFWYGDGINKWMFDINITKALQRAAKIRDDFQWKKVQTGKNRIKKTYVWSLDSRDSMEKFFGEEIDAIMVEKHAVRDACAIVKFGWENSRGIRMATKDDDAFKTFRKPEPI